MTKAPKNEVSRPCYPRATPVYAGIMRLPGRPRAGSLRRRDPENPAGGIVGGEPERAIRPLANVADALVQPAKQTLLLDDLLAVELEPHQQLGRQRADEQVAAPGREQVAGVESHSGRRDRRHPIPDRLLHAFLLCALVNLGAAVVDAEADHRPAVVLAGLQDVDLVAAARSVLVLPDLVGRGMAGEALRVAMSVTPDFGLGARLADERIVGRHRAVGPDADDLAEMVGEVLCLVTEAEMVAHRQEQVVVGGLHDAAAKMLAARERAFLVEDRLDVVEPRRAFIDQTRARERRAGAAVDRFGIAKIDDLVLRIAAIEHDVVQAALTGCEDFGHAGERRRQLAVLADDTQATGPLGDQQAAVRQEGERPRIDQAAREGLDRHLGGRGASDLRGGGRARDGNEPGRADDCRRSHANLLVRNLLVRSMSSSLPQRCATAAVPASRVPFTWE